MRMTQTTAVGRRRSSSNVVSGATAAATMAVSTPRSVVVSVATVVAFVFWTSCGCSAFESVSLSSFQSLSVLSNNDNKDDLSLRHLRFIRRELSTTTTTNVSGGDDNGEDHETDELDDPEQLLLATSSSNTTFDDYNNDYNNNNNQNLDMEELAANSNPKFQPSVITTVESFPSTKHIGSLSNYSGTPWCKGRPTFWLVGHEPNETAFCYNAQKRKWQKLNHVTLDNTDPLNVNKNDQSPQIDRHDCVALDLNQDGVDDIVCVVGADTGIGEGYNEVYLTKPNNGRIQKMLTNHGLHKYLTMRTRLVRVLKGSGTERFLFIATEGSLRSDRLPNQHRMFRLTYKTKQKKKKKKKKAGGTTRTTTIVKPFFEEVSGPWIAYFEALCAVVVDIDGDGLDDLILCNRDGYPYIIQQKPSKKNGSTEFIQHSTQSLPFLQKLWNNVRVADLTGDGRPDLIVASFGETPSSFLRIYRGIPQPPFFAWADDEPPVYETSFRYTIPDIEIMDVNNDGIPDIYVVQVAKTIDNTYCRGGLPNDWWGGGVQPPVDWSPPKDTYQDYLLIGRPSSAKLPYFKVPLEHQLPGCGAMVQQFGDSKRMILAQGGFAHAGPNFILEW